MEFTSELVFFFLDLYEKETALWDPKHPLHRNRNKMRDSWRTIKNSFPLDCSIEELKKKRDSLMANFRQLLHKVKKSKTSGSGPDDIYKPGWFAYDRMATFLYPVYEGRESIDTEGLSNNMEQLDEDVLWASEESASTNDLMEPRLSTLKMSPLQQQRRKRKFLNVEIIQAQMTDALKIMKTITNNNVDKDNCTIYGQLVANKLKEFDELHRIKIMNHIDNLLFHERLAVHRASAHYHQSTNNTLNYQYLATDLSVKNCTHRNVEIPLSNVNPVMNTFSPSYYDRSNAASSHLSPEYSRTENEKHNSRCEILIIESFLWDKKDKEQYDEHLQLYNTT